jgi:arylsulfatase
VRWRNKNDPNAALYNYNATAKDIDPGRNPLRCATSYEFTPTAWTGRETRNMLREFAGSSQPFFLFSSFFKPHDAYTVPEPYDTMYDAVEIPLPRKVTREDISKLPVPVQKLIMRRPQLDLDRGRLQWIYRSYYASVSMVDHEVSQILEELERSGKAQNTIILFASDHGDLLLEHAIFGKNLFFEASIHVPLMISWPGRVQPGRYDQLIETVDVLPALLDFCGIPVPANVQGRSFAPLVSGRDYNPREALFSENIIPEVITGHNYDLPFEQGKGVAGVRHPDSKMVRTKRWKLNYYPGNGGELYDLREDPGEGHNLYADPRYQNIASELKGEILEWLITADEVDQIAPRWLI